MGAFNNLNGWYEIDARKSTDDGPPGKPPGFNKIHGVYFKVDKSYNYTIQRDFGSSGWEMQIITFRFNTGLFGTGLESHWEVDNSVSTRDVEWLVAGIYKQGPFPSPGLLWNEAKIAKSNTSTISLSPPQEDMVIEFECSQGNFKAIIRANQWLR
jgi:hypothetical protein